MYLVTIACATPHFHVISLLFCTVFGLGLFSLSLFFPSVFLSFVVFSSYSFSLCLSVFLPPFLIFVFLSKLRSLFLSVRCSQAAWTSPLHGPSLTAVSTLSCTAFHPLPVIIIIIVIIIIKIITLKGAIRDFFTISSLRRELSPTRTLK